MFGYAVTCYLFLGGVGGGLCLVSSLVALRVLRVASSALLYEFGALFRVAFGIAAAVLLLASLFLLGDSTQIAALPYLFFTTRANYLTIGAWLLFVGIIASTLIYSLWGKPLRHLDPIVKRIFLAVQALVGGAIALYTGLFLASMKAVALWHTPLVPALFFLSSLSCGVVAFLAIARVMGAIGSSFFSYRKALAVDAICIVLETLVAALFIVQLGHASPETSSGLSAISSAGVLFVGEFSWLWWLLFMGGGLAVPFAFDVSGLLKGEACSAGEGVVLIVMACSFLGAFALRTSLVFAGAHPPLIW